MPVKIMFSLPEELVDRLKKAAEREDRKYSEIVKRALESYLGVKK